MVEIYDDRISIVSPGGVPKGITKENFGKRSIARNPIIADLLRRAHYIEKAGTGIERMRELMEDAGLKIAGTSPDGLLVEIVELDQKIHPYFIAGQFHPEFKSRPNKPQSLFVGLTEAAKKEYKRKIKL